MTSEYQAKDFVEKAGGPFGKVDALINLARLSIPGKIAETGERNCYRHRNVVDVILFVFKQQFKCGIPFCRLSAVLLGFYGYITI